ncbi:MAG: glycoside hydrolase family 31, partial [Bacteroidota bacterium]
MTKSPGNVSQRLGSFQQIVAIANGFAIETSFAHIQIISYSDKIIRIHAFRDVAKSHSYAVELDPSGTLSKDESKSHLLFGTESVKVEFSKDTSTFRFLNLDGEVINADDEGFGISWIGEQITNYKVLQEGEKFIGLGEKTGNLNRRGKAYQHWNTDQYAYDKGTDPLYCSTPFYIGLHS